MPQSDADSVASGLAARIGYTFKESSYLKRALTHSSSGGRSSQKTSDNERLEFLGDRVLGLVIAEILISRFPDSTEGELAPRFNALVRKEACADVARQIDLGNDLIMSQGEAQAGGRRKEAILGDACEALIAAIYSDGGLAPARAFIERFWLSRLDAVEVPPRDPKTMLQESLQSRGLAPPEYKLRERCGPDHAPVFTIALVVDGQDRAKGSAGSKRAAEQIAAEEYLRQEGLL